METEKVSVNPEPGSKCTSCSLLMKKGEESCFYEEFAHNDQDPSKTNIFCWKCIQRRGPPKTTKSNKVLLRDICKAYDVESRQMGEEYDSEESIKLWDTYNQCVRSAQSVYEETGSVEIGKGRFVFLEDRVNEMQKLLEEEIEEMDNAIAHYEREGKKIDKMRQKVIRDVEGCEEELRDCGDRRALSALQDYFRKEQNKLDNQEEVQVRLKQEEEKMARREHTLKSRAHAIEEFVKDFLDRPALWMKVDPLKLMEQDKEFWGALNQNWNQQDFDLSYGEPQFKFANDSVIDRLFKVEFSGEEEILEIKDYN